MTATRAIPESGCSLPGVVAASVLHDRTRCFVPHRDLAKPLEQGSKVLDVGRFGESRRRDLEPDDYSSVTVDMKRAACEKRHRSVERDNAQLDTWEARRTVDGAELIDHYLVRAYGLPESSLSLNKNHSGAWVAELLLAACPLLDLCGIHVRLHRHSSVAGDLECAENNDRLKGPDHRRLALEGTPTLLEREGVASLDHKSAVLDSIPGATGEPQQLVGSLRPHSVAVSECSHLVCCRQGLPALDPGELRLRQERALMTPSHVDLPQTTSCPRATERPTQLGAVSISHLRVQRFDGVPDAVSTTR